MEIKLQSIRVRDLVAGYENDADKGVWGYGGRLDIRPPYQREFRYDLKQKQAVGAADAKWCCGQRSFGGW